ncbi:type VII secretion target [Nocardia sp. NBC_01503]|uniref:type VII secretion target n=1 Tax=Nocardia sp. NBC_01503 TaxID=2975997 RepID=UPI002E7BDE64|nr:type VII secretion target [Nocardia sp. NBC_01503]WTL32660.1 type VII secretion target [Nocardia sp. NBC_01503]
MPFEVNPDGLRAAAGALALLPGDIDRAPHLAAEPVAAKMPGSAAGAALGQSDALSRKAKEVLKARFDEFSTALTLAADTYQGTDTDAANRLAMLPDINSGDPHAGR